MDKIIAHLGIMPYVDRFSQNFLLARWSVSYLLMYTWHTLFHYPHGANAGCDLAGVAPVIYPYALHFLFHDTTIGKGLVKCCWLHVIWWNTFFNMQMPARSICTNYVVDRTLFFRLNTNIKTIYIWLIRHIHNASNMSLMVQCVIRMNLLGLKL